MSSKQFGKNSTSLLIQKASFFDENQEHLEKQQRIAEIYKKQPRRQKCKNCDSILPTSFDFIKDGIEYLLCEQCGHLNGGYDDTDDFCRSVYTEDSGKEYAKNYSVKDKERAVRIVGHYAQWLWKANRLD